MAIESRCSGQTGGVWTLYGKHEIPFEEIGQPCSSCQFVVFALIWHFKAISFSRFICYMLWWVCGDKIPSIELKEKMVTELVIEVIKTNQLSWLGHVLQQDDDDFAKRSFLYETNGVRGRWTAMTIWNQVVEKDMRKCGLNKLDAQDWVKWKWLVWQPTEQTPLKIRKRP